MIRPSEQPCAHGERGLRLLVRPAWEAGALALGLDRRSGCEAALARARGVPGGRGPNRLLESPAWPRAVRLRPARHGGVVGAWMGHRHVSSSRVHRELLRWLALRERGAALPEPVLSLSRRDGLFWRQAFAAVDRPGAVDGAAWLASHDGREERPEIRRSLLAGARTLGRTLRAFHDAGAIHGDLQLRNVLFERPDAGADAETWRCLLIDLDRARLRSPVPSRARMKDLMRLARSTEKLGYADRIEPRLCARFLSAYCAQDRHLRRALLAAVPAERRRLRRHRLGWRLASWIQRLGVLGLALGLGLTLLACSAESPGSEAAKAGGSLDPPRLSLLAVGDTGRHNRRARWLEGQLAVAEAMVEEDRRSPVDAMVLLGDNFYWHGLDRAHLVERIRENLVVPYCHFLRLTGPRSEEVAPACPIDAAERHPIPILAVLGNHDLELPESARLQREAIPAFLPDWRMSRGLAEVVELGEGVSLILFESEIAIDDEPAIRDALIRAIAEAQGPWRIVATHRPIATDDLGGVPLGGYPAFVHDALAAAGAPVQLVLAGHHHSLQAFELLEPTPLLQIGLGSGSRAEPPLAHDDHPARRFAALALGFGRVDLRGDGAAERLVVSIYDTAPWPWLSAWRSHRLRARFEVDRQGHLIPSDPDH